MLLLFLFLLFNLANCTDVINLNSTNSIVLKGEINKKSVSDFLYELNQKEDKNDLIVYLDTNGGSVHEGMKIISELEKYNYSCIAERAYSMGFAILQSCKNRYILPHGSIMQHQMSLGIMNEKGKIMNYLRYINSVDDLMTTKQASRIGLSNDEFNLRTVNEWWLYGENALAEKCVDKVVNVECSSELTKSTYTKNNWGHTYTFSKCPLVSEPIKKKKNKDNESPFYFMI